MHNIMCAIALYNDTCVILYTQCCNVYQYIKYVQVTNKLASLWGKTAPIMIVLSPLRWLCGYALGKPS